MARYSTFQGSPVRSTRSFSASTHSRSSGWISDFQKSGCMAPRPCSRTAAGTAGSRRRRRRRGCAPRSRAPQGSARTALGSAPPSRAATPGPGVACGFRTGGGQAPGAVDHGPASSPQPPSSSDSVWPTRWPGSLQATPSTPTTDAPATRGTHSPAPRPSRPPGPATTPLGHGQRRAGLPDLAGQPFPLAQAPADGGGEPADPTAHHQPGAFVVDQPE